MTYHTILLIDDDIDDLEIFSSAVADISDAIRCTSMSSAKEALQKLVSQELAPDAIFLDLNMPIMTGLEFLEQIKSLEDFKSIPVYIFSTSAHPLTIAETKRLGAIDFITKPSSYDGLLNVLTPLLK